MAIVGLTRRLPEIGRIRAGAQVAMPDGRTRPSATSTWRLTAPQRAPLEAASGVYGGTVTPWAAPSGNQFQLTTETSVMPVIVAPAGVSQAFELWAAGGLSRRCDGQVRSTGEACACPADPGDRRDQAKHGMACSPTTRLSLLLVDLAGIGSWLYSSRSWNAAVELFGVAEVLEALSASGRPAVAEFRLEQRERRVPGEATKRFVVAVLAAPDLRMVDVLLGTTNTSQIGPGQASPMRQLPAPAGGSAIDAATILPGPARAVDGTGTADMVIICADVAGGFLEGEICSLDAGHPGPHRSAAESSWPALAGAST